MTKRIVLIAAIIGALTIFAFAQSPMLKRTTTKSDRFDFGVGGTVSIVGAPTGSIRVTGSAKNEIEITAEIEIQAATEADLTKIAAITTFITDESTGRAGIISVGTNNLAGIKKTAKKFPKNLLGMPYRIDYVVSVPQYCDLDINGGKGAIEISGVEGNLKINSVESDAKIKLIGGGVTATFGSGTVDIAMPDRSWRGNAIDVQLITGTMSVHLPTNLSADLDATILRTGVIENAFKTYKPRTRTVPFTDKSIIAKAGTGGVPMKFTVGDGTLRLERLVTPL